MENGLPPEPPSAEAPGSARLESWKEIATYLGREIRTVQRWEKEEGLPVHRHVHRRQGTVYAYASELDSWRQARSLDPERAEDTPAGARRWRRWLLIAAGLVALVVAGGRSWKQPGPPRKVMLAVLPFQNLSGDPAQDYFSDGLTEEMITQLARLKPDQLGVIARTSVLPYKGGGQSLGRIGRELGVDYVLEGGVRRDGDRVRVTAQLIQLTDQAHLWADSYERKLSGILAVQGEIASEVARAIALTLTPAERAGLAHVQAVDPEAYEAYLRGRQHFVQFDTWSRESIKSAKAYFEQAIGKDPGYAPAHSWLASTYAALGQFGDLPPGEAFPAARRSAQRALALDPRLADAYASLAWVSFAYDRDWARTEAELRIALEMDPNSPRPHWTRAWYFTAAARHEAAIAEMRRARELDPLNPFMSTSLGEMYWFARRYDEALAQLRSTQERHPDYPRTYFLLQRLHESRGAYGEAIDAYERLKGAAEAAGLRSAFTASGARGYWEWLLTHEPGPRARWNRIAAIHAALGDRDRALALIDAADRARQPAILLRVSPVWDPLRDDPRFQALLRRTELTP